MKCQNTDIHLFLRLEPDIPKLTHQNGIKARAIRSPDGRSWIGQIYKSPALRDLEAKYISLLRPYAPPKPWSCPIFLSTIWYFSGPSSGITSQRWKTTKPDTDNLVKTLKDCLVRAGFFKDDALVSRESIAKFFVSPNQQHGISIQIYDLTKL